MPWVWVAREVALAIHDEQLAEHGGATGVRDLGLLESALARPQNLAVYDPDADAAALAAAYATGIARNHPFTDGNKRTAFVAMELFLELNGHSLTANDTECVTVMLGVADGSVDDAALADCLRSHMTRT